MKLSQLITDIGDQNISAQWLTDSLIGAQYKKKSNDTEITFATNALTVNELMKPETAEKVALILWLPKDQVDSLMAADKARKVAEAADFRKTFL